jgi:hypothetical protein
MSISATQPAFSELAAVADSFHVGMILPQRRKVGADGRERIDTLSLLPKFPGIAM